MAQTSKEVRAAALKFWKSLPRDEFQKIRSDMKYDLLGHRRTLRCDFVISDYVLAQHTPLYKVFAKGRGATEGQCKDMFFIQNIATALGPEHAEDELWRYYDFYQRMAAGVLDVWPPRVFVEGGLCRRFDGKHRVCLLRHFGVKTVRCIVVTKRDILQWRTSRRVSDKHWTASVGGRAKRSSGVKYSMRRDKRRGRRDRLERSRARQKRKRAQGLI